MDRPPPSTRERLVEAMARSLRSKGLHGTGLAEVLAAAQAPKGVLYHHFPGGKTELAVAAIDAAVERVLALLATQLAAGTSPPQALARWVQGAQRQLERSGWEDGCPLAAVALQSGPQDVEIREALARGFARIRDRLAEALAAAAMPSASARRWAALVVATYEGGLMQARVAGSTAPLRDAVEVVLDALSRELPAPSRR